MKTQSLSGAWQFRQAETDEWLPATVPGGVHTDLLALGRIPDPFVGDNERRVQWVAEADWEFRRRFTVDAGLPAQSWVELVGDGLDTLATVSLNGRALGRADNMFRQYRWDVKELLHAGENELLIAFASPVRYAAEQQATRAMPGVSQAIPGGPHLRKAPCQFGWDWGPQLPPIGIWQDIRLEGGDQARLTDVHLRQSHHDGEVDVTATVSVMPDAVGGLTARLQLITPDGQSFAAETVVDDETTTLHLPVLRPQLWWPNGYGEQPLYEAIVTLQRGDIEIERRDYRLGLRTLELRQEEDEWGRSFEFVVNGVPIFAKGSNWIPADSFPTRITDEYLETLIRGAAETHQNMLRVWGGGFYEEERFYDLCDRYGILVWQDFIFSCSVYPLDDAAFLDNVHVEVEENVRRLRHRASLALWCGNNEMEWGWVDWAWPKQRELDDLKVAYDRFFHHTLPAWCAAADPDTTYWPSSPSSDTPFEAPNGQRQGDAHYWDVWHGRQPFTAYRAQYPRFMSEFGFQALPPLATIRAYAAEDDWNMTSYVMEQHQKNASGNSLMVGQMLDTFRLPQDFPSLVYLSMVLQAEGIRYGVEHWRRARDRVAGTLYWQLNDCWPVASWSSLDYFGRWKALHYAARRFYAPLLLSIEDDPPRQGVFVTNDRREPWDGRVRWSLETLAGVGLAGGEQAVQAAGQATTPVGAFDLADYVTDDNRRDLVFIAELWQGDQLQARQAAYFAPTKHLQLVEPRVTADCAGDGQSFHVTLRGRSLARLVEVTLEGADVVFSDNYFDLPAGRAVTVTGDLPAGWDGARVAAALRIRSVYDSFQQHGGN
ncbi:putative beta-mannosidase [Candidatus Promineifilum breve]|uniref:Beta-mannosidase B n=1 Tax=Candidatus Promineifilum breve TaxID=1806508 RepID=A0A160T492_9CHLR|nr:glycoside hydrolase family 2 protein [Candidatus Promineifilum breve]CUS03525.2 putative beta-mannosidase [Candidatus Promineifilum breve]